MKTKEEARREVFLSTLEVATDFLKAARKLLDQAEPFPPDSIPEIDEAIVELFLTYHSIRAKVWRLKPPF